MAFKASPNAHGIDFGFVALAFLRFSDSIAGLKFEARLDWDQQE